MPGDPHHMEDSPRCNIYIFFYMCSKGLQPQLWKLTGDLNEECGRRRLEKGLASTCNGANTCSAKTALKIYFTSSGAVRGSSTNPRHPPPADIIYVCVPMSDPRDKPYLRGSQFAIRRRPDAANRLY